MGLESLEAQSPLPGTFWFGDKEITLIKLKQSRDIQNGISHYVTFPFTDTGLHVSYHSHANPILQEEKSGRNLAILDMESAKKLTVKDFRSMFRYPRHKSDILVIPIDSLSVFEKMAQRPLDIPYPFEVLFSRRLIYRVRASTLREFLAANRGTYAMIDPLQDALLIYGEGFEKWGPMRLGLNHPLGSRGLSNLLSIHYALLNYLESHDTHVKIPEPSDRLLSEWIARLEMLFSEVKVVRWNKDGRIREMRYRDSDLSSLRLGS
jgi:hypothetical protein